MPLILPPHLPAIEILQQEHVHLETYSVSTTQKPIRLAVLNLMPLKIQTETDLVRVLSYTPYPIEIHLMRLSNHVSTHTSTEHMKTFYRSFKEMRDEEFDGMIITGAPVEHLEYTGVSYWGELTEIMDWTCTHVRCMWYICWAAQAALYYRYGIPKYGLSQKMFGIFPQKVLQPHCPLFRGFDDIFNMPHSRHTEVRREDIAQRQELEIIAESQESGVSIVISKDGREVFLTGHPEYSPLTLDTEYRRDLSKGLPIQMPQHYYRQDDPSLGPMVSWKAHAHLLYTNWIQSYVVPNATK